MNTNQLEQTAQAMVATGKGILAADQGASFVGKWLDSMGQPTSEDTLVQYRAMLFGTPQLSDHISGIILLGDVPDQHTAEGKPLLDLITRQTIMPGLSPSTGLQPLLHTLNAQDQGLGAFSRVQERGGGQEVAGTSERHGHLSLP